MREKEFREFVSDATEYLQARIAHARAEFGLGDYDRYDLDLITRRFWWTHQGVPKVEARLTVVGTYLKSTETWLWAWANPAFEEEGVLDIDEVRLYGQRHGIQALTDAKWSAEEVDGWEMTSIAARLLESAAAYRCPTDTSSLFVLLDDLRFVSE